MTTSPQPPAGESDREQRWMERVRAGDRAAFRSLHDRFAPPLMRFLYRLCRDRALAEDLVQETFLAAWTAAPRWRPEAKVATWLFAIAKRRWWKRGRRRARRPEVEARAARERPTSSAPAPDVALANRDEVLRLEAALADLPPGLRLVFVLVRLEGLPYAEAARIAGVRLGTAKSRMAAAEARLRARLGGPTPSP